MRRTPLVTHRFILILPLDIGTDDSCRGIHRFVGRSLYRSDSDCVTQWWATCRLMTGERLAAIGARGQPPPRLAPSRRRRTCQRRARAGVLFYFRAVLFDQNKESVFFFFAVPTTWRARTAASPPASRAREHVISCSRDRGRHTRTACPPSGHCSASRCEGAG